MDYNIQKNGGSMDKTSNIKLPCSKITYDTKAQSEVPDLAVNSMTEAVVKGLKLKNKSGTDES